MSRVVFIFGAGASVTAGGPLLWDFLDVAESLGRTLDPAARQPFDLVFKAYAALQPLHAKANLPYDNIEALFAAFEMAALCDKFPGLDEAERMRLIPSLKAVIAKTLDRTITFWLSAGGQLQPPEPYATLASQLRQVFEDRPVTFSMMTFNYDLALDYALEYQGWRPSYYLGEAQENGVPLLKLHGSLNWVQARPSGPVIACPLQRFFTGRQWIPHPEGLRQGIQLRFLDWLPSFRPDGPEGQPCGPDVEPYIVPPTWDKTRYHKEISRVWRAASKHLAEAEHIAVVGYSLPETDMFFRYLYGIGTLGDTRLKSFMVLDPDRSGDVERRFRSMLGRAAEARFRMVRAEFQPALGMLVDIAKGAR